MNDFQSVFSSRMLLLINDWSTAGHDFSSLKRSLLSFDEYCLSNDVDNEKLTKDLVCGWLQHEMDRWMGSTLLERANAIRKLARYYLAEGHDAYVLPTGYMAKYTPKQTRTIRVFTDNELSAFFNAADTISMEFERDPWIAEVAPVMFRMQYTCGLRPNEVREIKCKDVDLNTGEVLIRHNKGLKQRIVVMSSDMTLMCRKYLSRKSIFAPEKEYLSRGKRMIFIQTIITLIYSIDAGNERILEFQKRTSVLLDHTI